MRTLLYVAAIAFGIVLALLGEEPRWFIAVAALLIFPVGTGLALRERGGRAVPLGLTLLGAVAGGVLIALALRLAIDAQDWRSPTCADSGGIGTGTQELVLWAAAVIFVISALPLGATLLALGSEAERARRRRRRSPPGASQRLSDGRCGLQPGPGRRGVRHQLLKAGWVGLDTPVLFRTTHVRWPRGVASTSSAMEVVR